MMSEHLALRLEGRMALEHYAELPAEKSAYNSTVTLGFSYFTAGRRAPPVAVVMPPRVRVDTVWRTLPAPPPPPRKCEHGVAPTGYPVDQYGCLVLRDTLVLRGVRFDFDKSEITPTAREILDRVAE
jgi:outer membrane protein OmpA-like peptidoglycan-associated protein